MCVCCLLSEISLLTSEKIACRSNGWLQQSSCFLSWFTRSANRLGSLVVWRALETTADQRAALTSGFDGYRQTSTGNILDDDQWSVATDRWSESSSLGLGDSVSLHSRASYSAENVSCAFQNMSRFFRGPLSDHVTPSLFHAVRSWRSRSISRRLQWCGPSWSRDCPEKPAPNRRRFSGWVLGCSDRRPFQRRPGSSFVCNSGWW